MRNTLTNERKMLQYLFGVPYIQRRQIMIALLEIPYRCMTRAVRTGLQYGYIEIFTKDRSRHLRTTKEGIKYIRSVPGVNLDTEKRAVNLKDQTKLKIARKERMETTFNLCKSTNIPLADSVGMEFWDLLGSLSEKQEIYFDSFFKR